jgi:integrin beta 3
VSAAGLAVPPDLDEGPSRALPDVRSAPDDGPGPRLRGTGAVTGAATVGGSSRAVASAGAGPADSTDADSGENVGGLRGARSELRNQMRAKRRLRVLTLVSLSVVVLGLLPLFFGIRTATRDPVFTSIDALDLPVWAATDVKDQSSGSRWCFIECRFRERTAQSQQPFAQTGTVYANALTAAGWQRRTAGPCADQPIKPEDGTYTCWQRDEFTLDLWVRLPECAVDAIAAQDPAALPSTGPDGTVSTAPPEKCTGSTVSIKVQNAITDTRGKPGQEEPGLTGETPDPVLSNDPLVPTPSPS